MTFDEWVRFSQTSDQMPGEGALIWRMLVDWSEEHRQRRQRQWPPSALLAGAVVGVMLLAGVVWYVWCRCPP